jgi:hypothetical protein
MGAFAVQHMPHESIYLPNNTQRFYILDLSLSDTYQLDILKDLVEWYPLDRLINITYNYIMIFVNGRQLCRSGSYIKRMPNGAIYVAVNLDQNAYQINSQDDIYIRFYKNDLYNSAPVPAALKISLETFRYLGSGKFLNLTTDKTVINTTLGNDLVNLVDIRNYLNTKTNEQIFLNGLFIPTGMVDIASYLNTGDILEYVLDGMITHIERFNYTDLRYYYSERDERNKVIVSTRQTDTLPFMVDLEFYISGTQADGKRVGAYYPKLKPENVRILTYLDWGLDAFLINGLILSLQEYGDVDDNLTDIEITLIQRQNKEFRAFPLDSSHIVDLMNLQWQKRIPALAGAKSNLSLWKAENLENGIFNSYITLPETVVETQSIIKVLSRQGVISTLEEMRRLPQKTDFVLPPIAFNGGILMNNNLTHYVFGTSDFSYTEVPLSEGNEIFIPSGSFGGQLNYVKAPNAAPLYITPGLFNFKCFVNKDGVYSKLNEGIDYSLTVNTTDAVITWLDDLDEYEIHIFSSNRFSLRALTPTLPWLGYGCYSVAAKPTVDFGLDKILIYSATFGRFLTEGIDFNVYEDNFYFCSKIDGQDPIGTYRIFYFGLPDDSMAHVNDNNYGFLERDTIFNGKPYDLFLNRNKKFFINGVPLDDNNILFSENYSLSAYVAGPVTPTTGMPYFVMDIPPFTLDKIIDSLSTTKEEDEEINKSVADFVTALSPVPVPSGVETIPGLYLLVSPFMDKITKELLNGSITILGPMTKTEMAQVLQPYFYILNYDPTSKNIDQRFVKIAPIWDSNTVNVNALQFGFLNAVNTNFLNGQIDGLNLYYNVI